jgi:hypothetical protein
MDMTVNSWDDPEESAKWTQGGNRLTPLALKWHQLCSVTPMVDKMFVQPHSCRMNICLPDDVGPRKSAQIMALITFLLTVWFAKVEEHPKLPSILSVSDFYSCLVTLLESGVWVLSPLMDKVLMPCHLPRVPHTPDIYKCSFSSLRI